MTPTSRRSPDDFPIVLRRARRGDERAWDALYRWLAPDILGFLRGCRCPDPEDVLGDVFLDVARGIGGFKGDALGLRAWAFTIARSRRVDAIRRLSRRPEETLAPEELELSTEGDIVADQVVTAAEADEMARHLGSLGDAQREVIVLRFLVGLTAREIGEITGRSTGAIEQLQHRALASLRVNLPRA